MYKIHTITLNNISTAAQLRDEDMNPLLSQDEIDAAKKFHSLINDDTDEELDLNGKETEAASKVCKLLNERLPAGAIKRPVLIPVIR